MLPVVAAWVVKLAWPWSVSEMVNAPPVRAFFALAPGQDLWFGIQPVSAAVFGGAILALWAAGQPTLAAIFLAVLVLNEVLIAVWDQRGAAGGVGLVYRFQAAAGSKASRNVPGAREVV